MKKFILSMITLSLLLLASIGFTQDPRLRPSGDAVSACIAHSEGESCFYRDERSRPISGKCVKSDERQKACTEQTD